MKYSPLKSFFFNLALFVLLPVFFLAALLPAKPRKLLVWGSAPLISNKYWSAAMRAAGHESLTLMEGYFSINGRSDFDLYFEDFAPQFLPMTLRRGIGLAGAFIFVLRRASVVHTNFDGFALGRSIFWRLEAPLYRLAGVKSVVMAYGADAYLYSRVIDTSLRYGLLASYPGLARSEREQSRKVGYWNHWADVVIVGLMVDGLGRWDVTANQYFVIDTDSWSARPSANGADGRSSAVRILHTPNHRGFKGTEFLKDAVETLRAEGLNVELVLLEKVPNEEVRNVMQGVDILAEQFVATGYAFSGIEGMASGLPVLANLDHEAYTRVFRRYGFLDECPILSTPPERLVENLRVLVTNPGLREALGRAGRQFAEKYHSYAMAQYMFGSIYRKILDGENVDLINLFHPLTSEYNRRSPKVVHPLKESRLPPDWGDGVA